MGGREADGDSFTMSAGLSHEGQGDSNECYPGTEENDGGGDESSTTTANSIILSINATVKEWFSENLPNIVPGDRCTPLFCEPSSSAVFVHYLCLLGNYNIDQVVIAEDLFYNIPDQLMSLYDRFRKYVDVITRPWYMLYLTKDLLKWLRVHNITILSRMKELVLTRSQMDEFWRYQQCRERDEEEHDET
jgi:hypothetical protein